MYDDFERRYRQGGARAREEHLARLPHAPAPAHTPAPTVEVDKHLSGIPGREPLFGPKNNPMTIKGSDARADSRGRHRGKATLPRRGPPEAA
jgi:hypothetical protein